MEIIAVIAYLQRLGSDIHKMEIEEKDSESTVGEETNVEPVEAPGNSDTLNLNK